MQKDEEWFLQHRLKTVQGHHNERLNKTIDVESWYTMYKFTKQSRELWQFQPRCTQYETDPITRLSFLPIIIIKAEEGKVVKMLIGTRFSTVTFEGSVDVITNNLNLSDEELNKSLADVFGIHLNKPIEFNVP